MELELRAKSEPEYTFESNQHRVGIRAALRIDKLTHGGGEGQGDLGTAENLKNY